MNKEKTVNVRITGENHKLLTERCIKIFLKNYPDIPIDVRKITIDFILERICLYYLDEDKPFDGNFKNNKVK